MLSKADHVLLRAEAIASRRVQGATWPQIATWLQAEGLAVTDGQARVYWHRQHGTKSPGQVLAEARARAWEERFDALAAATNNRDAMVQDLRDRLAAAEAERDELKAQLAARTNAVDLAQALAEAEAQAKAAQAAAALAKAQALAAAAQAESARLAEALEQVRGQATAAQAEAQSQGEALAAVQTEAARLALALEQSNAMGELWELAGYGKALAEIDAATKARDAAKETADDWTRFGRGLAEAHKAQDWGRTQPILDSLVSWAYPQKPDSGA